MNQRSSSKANAGIESCKPKAVENDGDSDESMFEYILDQSELSGWSDIDDITDNDENIQLVEAVFPPVEDVVNP